MGIIEAIILGVIQGLTEFLPVSSSGHIILGEYILDAQAEEKILYIIVLHLATALSTVLVFRKRISKIFRDLFTFQWNDSYNFSFFILISMVPAGLAGFLIEDPLDNFLNDPSNASAVLSLVGACLLVTGGLLLFSDYAKPRKGILNYWRSFVIGIAQAIAILPGVSRSGSTISTALLIGVNRKKAAEFSFLMVLPVIFGAMLKKGLDLAESGIGEAQALPLIIGFIAAFISGFIACKWMLKLIQNSKLKYFAFYCFIVGIVAIVYTFLV